MSTATLPSRNEVNQDDCWDLTSLYPDDQAWEADFKKLEAKTPAVGILSRATERISRRAGRSVDVSTVDFDRIAERLGTYAFLKTTEDQTDSTYQAMKARFQNLAVRASQAASYMRPEILAIAEDDDGGIDGRMPAIEPCFACSWKRLLRYRAHTLD